MVRTFSSLSLQQQNAASSALSIMENTAIFIKKMLRTIEIIPRKQFDDEIESSMPVT
jgi:hypothetical protein